MKRIEVEQGGKNGEEQCRENYRGVPRGRVNRPAPVLRESMLVWTQCSHYRTYWSQSWFTKSIINSPTFWGSILVFGVNEPTPVLMKVKVSLWSQCTNSRTDGSQSQFIVTAPPPTYLWESILIYSHCTNSHILMGVNLS